MVMMIEDPATEETQETTQEVSPEQGGDLKDTSLLTKPDGESNDTRQDATKEGDTEKGKEDSAEQAPDKPEGYALKFADTVVVDEELLAGFRQAAHELGISQSKAQKLADMYADHAAKAGERIQSEQVKAMESAKAQWEEEIQKSPAFTQERVHARAALRQYGSQELYDLLDQTNLGSHPKMWDFLSKIGKALAEPGFKGESISGPPKTAAEILYPNQGKQ